MGKGLEWASEESPVTTRGDIIRWGEARRSHFNGFVLGVGFASWLLVMTAGSAAVKPGEDFVEPFAMFPLAVICVVMSNVCYTLGWVVDTVSLQRAPHRPGLRSS